jgi:hypothetical protein
MLCCLVLLTFMTCFMPEATHSISIIYAKWSGDVCQTTLISFVINLKECRYSFCIIRMLLYYLLVSTYRFGRCMSMDIYGLQIKDLQFAWLWNKYNGKKTIRISQNAQSWVIQYWSKTSIIRPMYSRLSRFMDFRYLTTEFGLAKESKIQVLNTFFFIFMSSYAEMSFWSSKKSLMRVNFFILQKDW